MRIENMLKIDKRNKKGFTLIEIVVAIAILGLMSAAFMTMFSTGIKFISDAGKKTDSHYTAQNQLESNLSNASALPAGNIVNVTSGTSINLTFTSGGSFNVTGRKIDVNYNYGGNTKKLTTFTTH